MCKHGTSFMAYNCDCWVCAQAARPTRKGLLLGLALGLLAAWGLGSVKAQEVRPLHGHAAGHEMSMHDQFYSKWMRPPERKSSCCNKEDCFPTQVKVENGVCLAWKPEVRNESCDEYTGECYKSPPRAAHWVVFNCALLEENQTDPEESPDGQSHACIARYTDQVYCAARGSMQ